MKKLILIFIIGATLFSCSKEEAVTPESITPQNNNNQVISTWLLNYTLFGGIATNHKVYINGIEKTNPPFNVNTNDILTGYSYTFASMGNNIGIIVTLDGVEEYNLQQFKAQNDTLFYNLTIK